MKKAFFTIFAISLCCLVIGNISVSAKEDEEKAQEKAEKKRLNEIQDSLNFVRAMNALENMDFVVKADQVTLRDMVTVYPNNNTNFIAVQNGKAVIQIASDNGFVGPNGLGGVTVEGTVAYVKKYTDKKDNFYLDFNVSGLAISAQVNIMLPNGSKKASVTIFPNFGSNNLGMYGTVSDYDDSNIFQGRTI